MSSPSNHSNLVPDVFIALGTAFGAQSRATGVIKAKDDAFYVVKPEPELFIENEYVELIKVAKGDSDLALDDVVVLQGLSKQQDEFFAESIKIDKNRQMSQRYWQIRNDHIFNFKNKVGEIESNLNAELKSYQEKSANLDKEIEERNAKKIAELEQQKQKLREQEAELESRKLELDQYATLIEEEQEALRFEKKEVAEIENIIGKGVIESFRKRETILTSDALPQDLKIGTNYLQELTTALQEEQYLTNESIVRRFLLATYSALSLGQLIILSGPTGSGKSSLISKVAHQINAEHQTIPVRPAWLDASDLLGFYDFSEQRFQPTQFTECLVEAKKFESLNRLYFLNLDELNLGRIENYAADLLSLLEKSRSDSSVALPLYASKYEQQLAKRLSEQENVALKEEVFLELRNYPSKLAIAQNLIFCGTMNFDDAGFQLSPKILDRSLIVQMPLQQKLPDLPELFSQSVSFHPLSLSNLKISAPTSKSADYEQLWRKMQMWYQDYLFDLGIHISHRAIKVFSSFREAAAIVAPQTPPETVLTDFMLTKVLPTLAFHEDEKGKQSKTKLDILKSWHSTLAESELKAEITKILSEPRNGYYQYLRS